MSWVCKGRLGCSFAMGSCVNKHMHLYRDARSLTKPSNDVKLKLTYFKRDVLAPSLCEGACRTVDYNWNLQR